MFSYCGAGQDSWEFLGQRGDPTSPSWRKSVLNIHWKDWCWSWSSNTLASGCEEPTHLKRPWCWERLRSGREGGIRVWDGWMASLTQWTWVWANSGRWWRTRKPGMLQSTGSQCRTQLSDWTTTTTNSKFTIWMTFYSLHHLVSAMAIHFQCYQVNISFSFNLHTLRNCIIKQFYYLNVQLYLFLEHSRQGIIHWNSQRFCWRKCKTNK